MPRWSPALAGIPTTAYSSREVGVGGQGSVPMSERRVVGLVAAASTGDELAWGELVRRYTPWCSR